MLDGRFVHSIKDGYTGREVGKARLIVQGHRDFFKNLSFTIYQQPKNMQ